MGGDTQGEQVTKVCAVESHSPIVPVAPRNAGSILIYIYIYENKKKTTINTQRSEKQEQDDVKGSFQK